MFRRIIILISLLTLFSYIPIAKSGVLDDFESSSSSSSSSSGGCSSSDTYYYHTYPQTTTGAAVVTAEPTTMDKIRRRYLNEDIKTQ